MKTLDEARKSCREASRQVQEAEWRLRLARKAHELARLESIRAWVRGALERGLIAHDLDLVTVDDGSVSGCVVFPPGQSSDVPDELWSTSEGEDWMKQLPIGIEVYIPEISTFSGVRRALRRNTPATTPVNAGPNPAREVSDEDVRRGP